MWNQKYLLGKTLPKPLEGLSSPQVKVLLSSVLPAASFCDSEGAADNLMLARPTNILALSQGLYLKVDIKLNAMNVANVKCVSSKEQQKEQKRKSRSHCPQLHCGTVGPLERVKSPVFPTYTNQRLSYTLRPTEILPVVKDASLACSTQIPVRRNFEFLPIGCSNKLPGLWCWAGLGF